MPEGVHQSNLFIQMAPAYSLVELAKMDRIKRKELTGGALLLELLLIAHQK